MEFKPSIARNGLQSAILSGFRASRLSHRVQHAISRRSVKPQPISRAGMKFQAQNSSSAAQHRFFIFPRDFHICELCLTVTHHLATHLRKYGLEKIYKKYEPWHQDHRREGDTNFPEVKCENAGQCSRKATACFP